MIGQENGQQSKKQQQQKKVKKAHSVKEDVDRRKL